MYISKEIQERILTLEPAIFKNAFPKIFSWEELEKLLNFRSHITLNHRFRVISCNENFSWDQEHWISEKKSIPPKVLDQQIIQKYHCMISDCSRANKHINNICNDLENLFKRSAADAHIFFNLANEYSRGFGIHWDTSYNLILQVEGNSKIEIWSKDVIGPPNGSIVCQSVEPILVDALNPGDATFIPNKTYHQITSLSKRLSISFPVELYPLDGVQDRHWINICK